MTEKKTESIGDITLQPFIEGIGSKKPDSFLIKQGEDEIIVHIKRTPELINSLNEFSRRFEDVNSKFQIVIY